MTTIWLRSIMYTLMGLYFLTDFHTHILPGIDDGSRDVEMSISMLEEETRQQVKRIVATPHFYANRTSVEDFLARREKSLQRLRKALGDSGPQIITGAEVYYFPGMGRAEKLKELCIEGTNVILLEMPFAQWTADIYREVKDILQKQELNIVLAHVERYPEFQKDKQVWEQILRLPLTIQINGGSFLKGWSRKRMCMKLLQEQKNAIIGSDCHNMTSRRPNIAEARETIAKKLGNRRLELIDETVERVLSQGK